jgi:hypothetical protein
LHLAAPISGKILSGVIMVKVSKPVVSLF